MQCKLLQANTNNKQLFLKCLTILLLVEDDEYDNPASSSSCQNVSHQTEYPRGWKSCTSQSHKYTQCSQKDQAVKIDLNVSQQQQQVKSNSLKKNKKVKAELADKLCLA